MKHCPFIARTVFLIGLTGASSLAGPLTREANQSLTNLPAAPPVFGYTFTNAFPSLNFTNPTCLATPPGETNRLFVLEKRGRIIVITNLAAPTRSIFLDITGRVTTTDVVSEERGLLGLAFHPGYATNRFFYVYYTGNTNTTAGGGGNGLHDILARYQVSAGNPNQADVTTYAPILVQFDQAANHNGGDLHFGPEGYLYVSLGDEGDANDSNNNSQVITNDFFSAILRLDVDKRLGNLTPKAHHAVTTNYLVPADNPFIGATTFNGLPVVSNNIRTEFWAVGMRNPWRYSFDPVTGLLYCGDVGQGAREEIDIISAGKNYGWAFREGVINGPKAASAPPGFVHAPPLIDYPRSLGFAVTGGRVYRGLNISQLIGAYVYADYGSGNVWALRHSGTNVTQNQLLFTDPLSGATAGISAFGADPRNGDLLYCDVQFATNGVIKSIIYANSFTGKPFPPTLAETGAFTNTATLTPHAGVVPYDLNLPFWSDGATKQRWFSVPNTNLFISFNPTNNWSFPTGTVWVKHFELELTNGSPASAQRLETRLLVWNTSGGYGITYRWGNSPSNATLVSEGGLDEAFATYNADGSFLRTQIWHYPARSECLQCHNTTAGFALGFNTPQLHRDFDYAGQVTNQIMALGLAGYFSNNVSSTRTLRALAHPTNAAASLEYRTRSWLAANCANCHRPGGVDHSLWDARLHTPGPQAGIIDGALTDNFGNTSNRVVVRGSLSNSVLLTRIAMRGPNQMPPLATTLVDTQAVALIAAWITNDLPGYVTYPEWQLANFGATNAPNSAAAEDADGDRALNYLEYLTATDPNAATNFWQIHAQVAGSGVDITFPQLANRGFEIQSTTNLFSASDWQPLDLPGNEPFFWITNRTGTFSVPATNAPETYFRARVFEP